MMNILRNKEGDAGIIGGVVALLVAIIVGVLVWYKINGAVTGSGFDYSAANVLAHESFNATNTSAATIWTLFPIVGIVMIAGIILAIVTNFGRGSGA